MTMLLIFRLLAWRSRQIMILGVSPSWYEEDTRRLDKPLCAGVIILYTILIIWTVIH